MPKPINKDIGTCPCVTKGCEVTAHIRKIKNEGKLYLDCAECGSLRLRGQRFQDYILDNGLFFTPDEPTEEKKDVKKNDFQEDGSENFNFHEEPPKEKGILKSLDDWEL